MDKSLILKAINQSFAFFPASWGSKDAMVCMLSIGFQESDFEHRQQIIKNAEGKLTPTGPAVSWWQMERGGGILGVLNHPASSAMARVVCEARGVKPTSATVWEAMKTDDVLGAAFARLLLYTNPYKLPAVGKKAETWDLYLREWKPGKPKPAKWPKSYEFALSMV